MRWLPLVLLALVLGGITLVLHHPFAAWDPFARACPDPAWLAGRASPPETRANDPALRARRVIDVRTLRYRCDVPDFLRRLFDTVTRSGHSELERGLVWVAYVQNTTAHACDPPYDSSGWALYHPIALLEERRLHCSQVARLIVDGFVAHGTRARVLQMNGHQSAEFFADGRWILAEGDILARGQFLRDASGRPVGIDEVTAEPAVLESVLPYSKFAPVCRGEFLPKAGVEIETPWYARRVDEPSRSARYFLDGWRAVFTPTVYAEWSPLPTPYVIKKTASPDQLDHPTYGWNHWVYCARSEPGCTN